MHEPSDYTTPLLTSDSSPDSITLQDDWGSSDEYPPVNSRDLTQETIENIQPYPGFVSSTLNFLQTLNQPPRPQQNSYQQDNLLFTLNSQQPEAFLLEYVHFPEKLFKTQKRAKGEPSRQIIECSELSFILDFLSNTNRDRVQGIKVRVKRTNESNDPLKSVGEVPLKPTIGQVQDTKLMLKVNLDVYEHKSRKVFDLERAQTDEYNMFHLIIEVVYKNGQVFRRNTKGFKLVGKKKAIPKAGDKREHANSLTSDTSECTDPSSGGSPNSMPHSPGVIGLIQARQVVADHIATKTLEIDGLVMGKAISTRNGDIAYHFPLQDGSESFEEGEVVGLFPGDKDSGKFVIGKLSLLNSKDAALKGVITRSQYLEAMVPDPSVPSETICMMGVVPVQIVGSVLPNEAIYASPNHPGCGISAHHLSLTQTTETAFIGYSFSTRKTSNENSMGFVQAGVSVLETAGKTMMNQRLRDVEESFDEKIKVFKKDRRRSRKCVIITAIISTTLVILISIFLWQLLMPGSAYRYYVCKMERQTPHTEAFYHFIPWGDIFSYPRVNGIGFDFNKLLKKTHHFDYKRLNLTEHNITGVRYYLNIDRCAYGGLRSTKDHTTGQKVVYGADIFAVDSKCFHAYYYNENKVNGWTKYNSVSWTEKQNIFCNPLSTYKNFKNREEAKATF